jgi:hypothetical protein
MAARVEVVHGPDAGWRFTVFTGEVRIGRGAGHQVRLTDPAWGDGHLRLQFRQGGYLVTNQMPYPIFIDGQLLPEGGQRTWYAGSGLQPTGDTLLRLEVIDTPPGPPPEGGVVAEPPGRRVAAKSTRTRDLVALGFVVVGLLGLGYRDFAKATPPTVAARYTATVDPVLADAADRPGVAGEQARAIRRAVRMGVYRETEHDYAGAKERYLEARQLIDAARTTGPRDAVVDAALEKALDFVSTRIQNLK